MVVVLFILQAATYETTWMEYPPRCMAGAVGAFGGPSAASINFSAFGFGSAILHVILVIVTFCVSRSWYKNPPCWGPNDVDYGGRAPKPQALQGGSTLGLGQLHATQL